MNYQSGRHFLQIPGPTNVPDRVLRALSKPTIDHRGPEFAELSLEVLAGLQRIFQTSGPVVVYPSSGTGAWEAALVNTLSPGDRVLMFETGHFATLWYNIALALDLEVDFVPTNWRHGVMPEIVAEKLAEDKTHQIKSVMVVHNETSTGVTSRIPLIREAMDRADHPALLMVDTISSLASIDYRHEAWGVDVTVGCSQKGLMLPPGLGLNAISPKALEAAKSAGLPKSFWDWEAMFAANQVGFFPYTPATNLLYGLREAIQMLEEEGLPNVFARHDRHASGGGLGLRAPIQFAIGVDGLLQFAEFLLVDQADTVLGQGRFLAGRKAADQPGPLIDGRAVFLLNLLALGLVFLQLLRGGVMDLPEDEQRLRHTFVQRVSGLERVE